MDRRQFLTRGLAGAAAATVGTSALTAPQKAEASLAVWSHRANVPEIFAPLPTPPRHSTALIIGSGFGGAISALRLAQAGVQTTVLERGSRWPTNTRWRRTFTSEVFPDGRALWHRRTGITFAGLPMFVDKFGGVMDISTYDNMEVWRGACVGGGSVVFTGVMIQPRRDYFDYIFKQRVSFDEMNQIYYPRVRQMLNLKAMPSDIYNSHPFAHSRSWDRDARKAGYEPEPCDSIFNWGVIREEMRGQRRKSAIIGESDMGNSNGAKYDLNQNYIRMAEDTGKARVYPGHQVENITRDGQRYVVDIRKISPTGDELDRYQLTCDYLFLGAGSIGTSELLVKAREFGLLPNLNEYIGEGWGGNGDALVNRSFSPVAGLLQSSPCASRIHDNQMGLPTTLENWYVPGVPINIGITGSLAMVMDDTRGRLAYNPRTGKVELQWGADNNRFIDASIHNVANRILDAAGGVAGTFPFREHVFSGFTAHPLGGAVLGEATDNYGRVKGYEGLYVMDGAMVPGSTGAVNPSLTISALAERNIEQIIQNDLN